MLSLHWATSHFKRFRLLHWNPLGQEKGELGLEKGQLVHVDTFLMALTFLQTNMAIMELLKIKAMLVIDLNTPLFSEIHSFIF